MVEIEIYKKRKVEYNPLKHEFQVWEEGEKILVAATQLEIEDMIDKLPEKKSRKRKGEKDETTIL